MATVEPKYNFSSERSDYMTPPEIYNIILGFIGADKFDFDACCSECNIPADIYNMPDGQYYLNDFRQKQKRPIKYGFYDFDGLSSQWFGICWLNPPFVDMEDWIKKAVKEVDKNSCEVFGIMPCRTETKFFKDCILQNPDTFFAPLRKGIVFIDPKTGKPCQRWDDKKQKFIDAPFKNSLCIVYFGKRAAEYVYKWNWKNPFNSVAFQGVEIRKVKENKQLKLIESR